MQILKQSSKTIKLSFIVSTGHFLRKVHLAII